MLTYMVFVEYPHIFVFNCLVTVWPIDNIVLYVSIDVTEPTIVHTIYNKKW